MAAELKFRPAVEADLPALVALLADDPLGDSREQSGDSLASVYLQAFAAIDADDRHELIIAALAEQDPVGMLQLSYIPGLSRQGAWRAQIEGVRVHRDYRSLAIGEKMIREAINRARAKGCQLVQLTSDNQRPDAIRFYKKLGFTASHSGLKLTL